MGHVWRPVWSAVAQGGVPSVRRSPAPVRGGHGCGVCYAEAPATAQLHTEGSSAPIGAVQCAAVLLHHRGGHGLLCIFTFAAAASRERISVLTGEAWTGHEDRDRQRRLPVRARSRVELSLHLRGRKVDPEVSHPAARPSCWASPMPSFLPSLRGWGLARKADVPRVGDDHLPCATDQCQSLLPSHVRHPAMAG